MKKQIGYLALAACAFGLQACGGSMLDTPDSEKHKLVPDPVEGDEGRPRPSDNAPILSSDGAQLLDATGEPVILRGVNLQYGDNPLERINGITSIKEVGSNVVRLQLRADTTGDELEAALLTAVDAGLIAVVTYWEPEVACAADDEVLFGAVNDLWLNEWVPVLVQDRFQPHIVLNLASKWGPTEIFNAYSQGYRIYIDNYKAVIGQMRRAGFRNPIMIDAPGCGQDYHAFLGNRGRELLAADDEENIILSVHAYGSRWRDRDDMAAAMKLLADERIPVVVSEFGDANAVEGAIRHQDLMTLGAGDWAVGLPIDWQTPDDKAGYLAVLPEPMSVLGREMSMEVYLDEAYLHAAEGEGLMGLQMYLRDSEDRYANLGWNSADSLQGNDWSSLKAVVQDNSSFGWAEDNFDASQVTKIGLELVANGKSPEVNGELRIDNIKVIEASVPEQLASWGFEAGADGWQSGWLGNGVDAEEGVMSVVRGTDENEVIALVNGIPGVSYDGDIAISLRVFIPASYAAESDGLYFAMFSNTSTSEEGNWQATNYLSAGDFTFGEWTSLTLQGTWEGGNDLGLQMGSIGGSYEPILFDDISLVGMPEEEVAFEWGEQYRSDFSADTDGFGVLGWGNIPVTLDVDDGALVILPRLSEVADPDGEFALSKNDLANLETLNLASERLELTLEVLFDAAYANAPSDYVFNIFIQDANWSNHTNMLSLEVEDITPGEWQTVHVEVELPEEFERNALPQYFGLQSHGLTDMEDAPITIGEIRIEGNVPVEIEEEVVQLVDFHYVEHLDWLEVDTVEGGLVAENLLADMSVLERSAPFSWLAWSWIGDPEGEDMDVLDLSNSEDTSVDLTERGEQIVHGKGGLMETGIGANFPNAE